MNRNVFLRAAIDIDQNRKHDSRPSTTQAVDQIANSAAAAARITKTAEP
jgi:hypothetical protein